MSPACIALSPRAYSEEVIAQSRSQRTWYRTTGSQNLAGLLVGVAAAVLALIPQATPVQAQGDPALIFAVVTGLGKDRKEVKARVYAGGEVVEAALVPTDPIKTNPVWKKLEPCQALRAEAWHTPEGFRLATVMVVDAGMLPMALQGVAGDCLLKKALEFAPLVD